MTFVLFAMTAASSTYSRGTRFAPVQGLRRVDKRGYPYAPCPTGPRSMAQKSSKGQLMLCRKLSDKNRKEWSSFLFLPSIFIYGFRYRPHRKKLFRLDEASGTRSTSPAPVISGVRGCTRIAAQARRGKRKMCCPA